MDGNLRKRSNLKSNLRSPILASLLVHAALVALLVAVTKDPPAPRSQPILLEFAKTPVEKKEDLARNRVVQTELAEKSKEAAPEAFLGKQTQTVARQSISENQQPQKPQAQKPTPRRVRKPEDAPAAPSIRALGVPILPKLADRIREMGEETPDRWADQAVSPHDYVDGMRESNRTLLNTKEYVYFSYFERVRRQLELAWYPILREHVEKLYRKGRKIASEMDHKTRILVTLNEQGAITRVLILEESGTRELDDAAIQAFNRAGPFPNPPRGLFDRDGKIEIRWDFILKT